ncbi:tetratricopeptide repeat protein [Novilysobacter antarcticus]|uniref:tetratricopeptide repeat protein n=1 Tax=Novilysobacter antarcticus TaxID=2862543 RepID=UPI001C992041|nr:tetratricopeptide repeat protein [Lysobacter antarcticus]
MIGISVIEDARAALQEGSVDQVFQILDDSALRSIDSGEAHALLGLAHLRKQQYGQAIANFDAALERNPDSPALIFNRAMAYSAAGRSDSAITEFARVIELVPDNLEAIVNTGIIHLRDENYGKAVDFLERALTLRPKFPQLMRSLANALGGDGRLDDALRLHAEVESMTGSDPAALTDFGYCLVSSGRFTEATRRFERALRLVPEDQSALAGLYLAANESGRHDQAAALMDYGRLMAEDRDAFELVDLFTLREAALAHPDLQWEPSGRSTRFGRQTPMLDSTPQSPFYSVFARLEAFVARRLDALGSDAGLSQHPWILGIPKHWRIQAWCTVLREGGCQSSHIHPAGWMSGVVYIDSGDPTHQGDGQLIFGHPPTRLSLDGQPLELVHSPASGQLLCFPSYFFHHTTPYSGTRPRISLAFDVIPEA